MAREVIWVSNAGHWASPLNRGDARMKWLNNVRAFLRLPPPPEISSRGGTSRTHPPRHGYVPRAGSSVVKVQVESSFREGARRMPDVEFFLARLPPFLLSRRTRSLGGSSVTKSDANLILTPLCATRRWTRKGVLSYAARDNPLAADVNELSRASASRSTNIPRFPSRILHPGLQPSWMPLQVAFLPDLFELRIEDSPRLLSPNPATVSRCRDSTIGVPSHATNYLSRRVIRD